MCTLISKLHDTSLPPLKLGGENDLGVATFYGDANDHYIARCRKPWVSEVHPPHYRRNVRVIVPGTTSVVKANGKCFILRAASRVS